MLVILIIYELLVYADASDDCNDLTFNFGKNEAIKWLYCEYEILKYIHLFVKKNILNDNITFT